MVRSALVVWMPALLTLAACAPALLPALFGQKWAGAVETLQAMSLVAFTLPLWFFVGEALSAAGRPDLYLRLAVVRLGVLAACISIGAQFGLIGAGLAWAATSACMVPLALFTLGLSGDWDWRSQVATALRITTAGLGFIACVLITEHTIPGQSGPTWVTLMLGAGSGLLGYVALLEFFLLPRHISGAIRDLRQIIMPLARAS
jgi:PST family polysaccharide transporter